MNRLVDKCFLKCSCKKWKKRGLPCRCFFRAIDNGDVTIDEMIKMSMIDIRYWKMFHIHYGDKTDIGKKLYEAQAQSFKYEHDGIQVSEDLLRKITNSNDESYPILGEGTTEEDYQEMLHVKSRTHCTLSALIRHRVEDDDEKYDQACDQAVVSSTAKHMQAAISVSASASTRATDKERTKFIAKGIQTIRFVGEDDRVSKESMNEFMRSLKAAHEKVLEDLVAKRPKKKNGAKRKSEEKRAEIVMCASTGDVSAKKKRKGR